MLKRLKVKNFRSLKDFETEFGKFNVLIGRNNSGKSNIIDVLNFISEGFNENLESLFNKRGGYKNVVFGKNDENNIEIEIEGEEDNFRFFYYICISGKYEQIKIVNEKLKIKNDELEKILKQKEYRDYFMDGFEFGYDEDVYHLRPMLFGRGNLLKSIKKDELFRQIESSIKENIIKDKNGEISIRHFYDLPFFIFFHLNLNLATHAALADIFLSIVKRENFKEFVGGKSEGRQSLFVIFPVKYEIEDIIKIIETGLKGIVKFFNAVKISTYNFVPYLIKKEISDAFVEKPVVLKTEGNNLSLVLLNLLQEDRKKFDRIQELLSGVIGGIEEIRPVVEGNKVYLKIKEKNFDNDFQVWTLADGTISLLAHITAIQVASNKTICFEEPENHIHMQLLEFIFELLKKSEKQIIISTHSPYFIDYCDSEDIIIVEKEKGETKTRRIKNIEKLTEFLDKSGMSLGEAYYSKRV
ncbi:MAG: hypothetical protein BWK75_05515 [Candidatus Altiarchaeales archaeon A3]|nr:MAG: hypothetical protein BWK75_05515 [Candidatus Altiarchaeales archaeon A3]